METEKTTIADKTKEPVSLDENNNEGTDQNRSQENGFCGGFSTNSANSNGCSGSTTTGRALENPLWWIESELVKLV